MIAAGGYPRELIRATQEYIRVLQRSTTDPVVRDARLRDLLAGPIEAGWIRWFEPYEAVHREYVAAVSRARSS